ncbi:MAG: transglutaminase domain-containing protein [Bacteroidota bacterium]
MRHYFLTGILSILFSIPFASAIHPRELDYSEVDRYVLALDSSKTRNLDELVQHLSVFDSEIMRFRAAFRWVAHNIAYDVEDLKRGKKRKKPQTAERTFADRSAVCGGYANLLQHVCSHLEINSEYVVGVGKNDIEDIQDKTLPGNHAWNAVKLDGKWYLCDVTWASGHVSERSDTFAFSWEEHWYLTEPAVFAIDHFPDDRQWFLGGERESPAEYARRPVIRIWHQEITFHKYRPVRGDLKSKKEEPFTFGISMKDGKRPSGLLVVKKRVRNAEGKIQWETKSSQSLLLSNIEKKGKGFQFSCIIPETGTYTILIRILGQGLFKYHVKVY